MYFFNLRIMALMAGITSEAETRCGIALQHVKRKKRVERLVLTSSGWEGKLPAGLQTTRTSPIIKLVSGARQKQVVGGVV